MKQALVIAEYELKSLLRTKKVVFTVIMYILLYVVAIKLGKFVELIAFFLPKFQSTLPFQILLPYYFSIFIIPLISILSLYDSISAEVENKSLKYIIYRVPRKIIIFGKFLAPFTMLLVINLVLFLISPTYVYYKTNALFFTEAMTLFAFIMLYSLYFLSFSVLGSTIFNSAARALRNSVFVAMLLFVIPLFFNSNILNHIFPKLFISAVPEIVKGGFIAGHGAIITVFVSMIILFYVGSVIIMNKKDIH